MYADHPLLKKRMKCCKRGCQQGVDLHAILQHFIDFYKGLFELDVMIQKNTIVHLVIVILAIARDSLSIWILFGDELHFSYLPVSKYTGEHGVCPLFQ